MNPLRTLGELLKHFLTKEKAFFIPFLLVLLLAGVLLLLTNGLSVVAPFVYAIF